MNKLLEQAIKEAAALPEDQQEELAARLLDEVRERAALDRELDEAIRDIDEGRGVGPFESIDELKAALDKA
jgi:hypothetical protein